MGAGAAAFWGFVGGVPLLVGAVIGVHARRADRAISAVMALGAGVLIASVAFDLMGAAFEAGGFGGSIVGLGAGSLAFFLADLLVTRRGGKHRKRSRGQQSGGSSVAIMVGALMDGIPESVAIGVSLVKGGAVSWVLVAAVFLSNLPEGLSAAAGMRKAGWTTRRILGLWSGVVAISTVSALMGFVLAAGLSGAVIGTIQAFAAGAILTMLASTMMPEAYESGGAFIGVVTTFGFLLAFVLGRLEAGG